MKIGTKVKVVNLIGTGLEGYEDDTVGLMGKIIDIDKEEPLLPLLVELDVNFKITTYHFHPDNLVIVGEDDVLE